jgi:serine/threonine protein kinase
MSDIGNRATTLIGAAEENHTRIMPQEQNPDRATSYMNQESNRTAYMSGTTVARATFSTSLSVGSDIYGIHITGIIAENTGEASLLLGEYSGYQYVLKLYHTGKQPKEELLKIISSLETPFVTRSLSSGFIDGRFCEILPYYSGRDLLSRQEAYSEEELEKIVLPCVNEGLKALHEHTIVHRDIKPSNLFWVPENQSVIIGDFGISSILSDGISVRATTMSRTFGYAAPETTSGFISKESDYYSLGITMLHLVTGQDPFIGMTDMQILYQTINKKILLPQTISNRFATLIRGLTVKERTDRWSYEQVKRWLNHEEVEVIEKNKKIPGVKPYQFNKQYYYSLDELSQAFALDWKNAGKHLYRGFVERNIEQYGQDLASICIDLKTIQDKDVAVFQLIYLLNPKLPLCYKGRFFNDIEHVGTEMAKNLPEMEEDILEMITNGCLEHYLKLDNAYDTAIVKGVDSIATLIRQGQRNYYYALMFLLAPQLGYTYQNTTFKTLEKLVESLNSLSDSVLGEFAEALIDDPIFHMWVYSLGYTQQVLEWLAIYKKAEW